MKLERTKNTARNVVAGYASRLILMVFPFLTRNIFIHCLGEEFLGLNGLFSSILSVLNMAELGFSSAIIVHLYQAIADDDSVTINALLNYYRKIYRTVGAFIICAGSLLIPFLPQLIKGAYPASINLTAVYLVYLFNTGISYFLFAYYSSLIAAFQRQDIMTGIDMVLKILMYVVQIILLLTVKNYYVYLTIMPVFTVVNNLWVYFVAKHKFPEYMPKGIAAPEIRTDIGMKVKGAVIGKVSAVFRNTFDSIFIAAFLGLTATAIYDNYYYILNTISSLMLILTSAITGGVGNSVAMESQKKNYQDMRRMNFLYMWIAGWCMTCMLCLYQPFMKLWMGESMLLPVSTMILFCAYLYIMKIGDVLAAYSGTKGLFWESRYICIAEAVANILLNYFLGKHFGVAGIMWATIISMIGINFLWGCRVTFKYYFTEYSANAYIMQHLKYGAVYATVAAITYGVCSFVKIPGFLGLIVIGIICVILPNVLYYVAYCRTESYKMTIPWLREKIALIISRNNG